MESVVVACFAAAPTVPDWPGLEPWPVDTTATYKHKATLLMTATGRDGAGRRLWIPRAAAAANQGLAVCKTERGWAVAV